MLWLLYYFLFFSSLCLLLSLFSSSVIGFLPLFLWQLSWITLGLAIKIDLGTLGELVMVLSTKVLSLSMTVEEIISLIDGAKLGNELIDDCMLDEIFL